MHNARAEDILDLLLDTEVRTDENTPDTGVRYEQNSADTEVGNEDNSANTESRHGKNMPHVETSGASVANASLSRKRNFRSILVIKYEFEKHKEEYDWFTT